MFALYLPGPSGEWQFVYRVVTVGRLLADRILEEAAAKRPGPDDKMPWEIAGTELRDRVVLASIPANERIPGGNYKLVIDATYSTPEAQLFEICYVWGYSDPTWSPLVMRLSFVCDSVNRPKGPETPVERFKPEDHCAKARDFVHEFLYLRQGHLKGKKNWGRVGFTNAALLWPAHLEHLLGKIGFNRATD